MPKAKINDVKINYEVRGEGKPLILIIGLGGPKLGWLLQIPMLQESYKVVSFDNRGIGKSSKPAGPYTTEMMAEDTVGLMNHLGIERAHIYGVSMGGMIAQELAINYPDRIEKLVLGCTLARVKEINEEHSDTSKQKVDEEDLTRTNFREILDSGELDFGDLIGFLAPLTYNYRLFNFFMRFSKIFGKIPQRLFPVEGFLGQLEAVQSHNTMDRLQEIRAPTLVIAGDADNLVPPICSDIIAERISGSKLVKIEGGSHAYFIEKARESVEPVLDFLKDC